MTPQERTRAILALFVFTVFFLSLTTISFTGMSATNDESEHLTNGYLSLKVGDYRLDPEHPPFLRMWAALPLLLQNSVKLPGLDAGKADPIGWAASAGLNAWDYSHAFMYETNDADHMLYPARFMISLLGVLLGIFIFCWAREWLGFWPAVFALAFYTLEPNILAHSSLVTTDLGVTCFIFGSSYFLWRTTRCLGPKNLVGLASFSALAAISKFSAIVLGPIFLIILAVRALRNAPWPRKIGKLPQIRTRLGRVAASAGILVFVTVACWGAIWAIYGFRYLPSSTPDWKYTYEESAARAGAPPMLVGAVHWIDSERMLPNNFSQGFLLEQVKSSGRNAFLKGNIRQNGWWYYFPVAFLIKTPITLIVLFLGGLVVCAAKWKEFLGNALFVLVPLCLYMGIAMSSNMNIGLRHILPIYPFVILLAAFCVAEVMHFRRQIGVALLAVLFAFWIFEFARVYPHNLAFFNSFIGGPQNGYKYLADSNIDWGQDLKGLKKWMDEHGVKQINLAYFGFADPSYYGIQCNYIAGGTFYSVFHKPIVEPQLPGYVAVSVTVLDGAAQAGAITRLYEPLADRVPNAVIGYSIHVYRVDDRWW